MRTAKFLALMGTIVLTGLSFSACSNEDQMNAEDINPTFDGQNVKTQFAINIPQAGRVANDTTATRMTGTVAQQSGNFRGLTNIYLYPMATTPASNSPFPYANIKLPDAGFTNLANSGQQRLYTDVSIAVGTQNFLFYAEAANPADTDDAAYGVLTTSLRTSLSNTSQINFNLEQIAATSVLSGPQGQLAAMLNKVARATYSVTTGEGDEAVTTVYKWAKLQSTETDRTYEALDQAYLEFANTTRIMAGSANGVKLMVQALYNNMYYMHKNSGNDIVKGVAQAVMDSIAGEGKMFTATYDAEKDGRESTTSGNFLAECYTLAYVSEVATLINYPVEQGLPEGAAQLTCAYTTETGDATNGRFATFGYVNPNGFTANSGNATNVEKLTYPAALHYFANTPLKATNKNMTSNDWANTTDGWKADDTWNNWTDVVTATTKNIALRNNIQYGVAMLATTVKCNTAKLVDNSEDGGGYDANLEIDVPTDGFPISGVFVGGQPAQVGWNFLAPNGADFDRVVVDNTMNGTMVAKYGASTPSANYTLLLDNYKSGASDQEKKVNVCIELTNNTGKDFYGKDGLIRNGQKFYLVGQLDPTTTTQLTAEQWAAKVEAPSRYPAYGENRVFMQDFTTTVNFTIKDLKKAYVTIPDLRIPQISLGLSVDLKWNEGVNYEIEPM